MNAREGEGGKAREKCEKGRKKCMKKGGEKRKEVSGV